MAGLNIWDVLPPENVIPHEGLSELLRPLVELELLGGVRACRERDWKKEESRSWVSSVGWVVCRIGGTGNIAGMYHDIAMFEKGGELFEDGIDGDITAFSFALSIDDTGIVPEDLRESEERPNCLTAEWTQSRTATRSSNATALSQPMSLPSMGDCQPGRTRQARQCPAITTTMPTPELASEKARASKRGLGRGMCREMEPYWSQCSHQSSLQLDEVRVAGRDDESRIDELAMQRLNLLQGVRQPHPEFVQDCQILDTLLLRKSDTPCTQVPHKAGELRGG
ncbi:hypothetical protein V8D89_008016 [Ganoderma adspersum]